MRKTLLITAILVMLTCAVVPLAVQAQDLEDLPVDPTDTGTFTIIVNVISFVIAIIIAIYMYKDAEKRGKSGILWGLIGFCCGCIGLIIWLIVRPPIQQAAPPGYYPPPQQPGYPPQQPGYPPQ